MHSCHVNMVALSPSLSLFFVLTRQVRKRLDKIVQSGDNSKKTLAPNPYACNRGTRGWFSGLSPGIYTEANPHPLM